MNLLIQIFGLEHIEKWTKGVNAMRHGYHGTEMTSDNDLQDDIRKGEMSEGENKRERKRERE